MSESSTSTSAVDTPTSSPVPSEVERPSPDEALESTGPAVDFPKPKLRLFFHDVTHPSTKSFVSVLPDTNAVIQAALTAIVEQLYTSPQKQNQKPVSTSASAVAPILRFAPSIPPTRSVTFIVRDMPGVAYTTGTELDNDHKEIHISLSYIATAMTYADPGAELRGVITHELVHCYQHTHPPPDASGHTIPGPPGGLIEGIADFVRLKANLGAAHWKRPKSAKERPAKWDAGYQQTAYFLEWIEDVKVGLGAVGLLNDRLLRRGYVDEKSNEEDPEDNENKGYEDGDGTADPQKAEVEKRKDSDSFWMGLFGASVADLWDQYGAYLDSQSG